MSSPVHRRPDHDEHQLRHWLAVLLVVTLIGIWLSATYEIRRDREATQAAEQARAVANARVFAEYSLSTLKRLDELLLDTRAAWRRDANRFADFLIARQANITDISLQVGTLDRRGFLSFTNLSRPTTPMDLSERLHYRVHAESPETDRLYISNPLKGKVSGKWSIQFTRPILSDAGFDGVMVISVPPELFASFAEKLGLSGNSIIAIVRDTGEMLARYPIEEKAYTTRLSGREFQRANAPLTGAFTNTGQFDGMVRQYGYARLPEHGLSFVVGIPLEEALRDHLGYRDTVFGIATVVTLLLLLVAALIRSLLHNASQSKAALQEAKEAAEQARDDAHHACQQAESANRAKSEFLANMSHEIRTPISAISGMVNLLRRSPLTSDQVGRLTQIEHASQHLMDVINAILDMSKIESGKLDLESVPVDVRQTVEEVVDLLTPVAQAKGLTLVADLTCRHEHLLGDPVRIRQGLINFTNNAIKFTEKGLVTLRCESLDETPDDRLIRFSVTDTGIGIEPEAMERLFQAFEQADNSISRKFGGTGLGLVLTRNFARLMGGDAGAESTPGLGSTFWFTARLPKAPVQDTAPEEAFISGEVAERRLKSEFAGRRILVVDDTEVNREIACDLLQEVNQQVECAVDGLEAVNLVRQRTYDLILMDMQMPGMDGVTATRAIRALPQGREVPIIAMTANAFDTDRDDCLAAGMNDFLSKPVDPDRLFATLLRWLQRNPVRH